MQIRMELLKVLMGVSISLERPSPRPFSLDPHYVCRPTPAAAHPWSVLPWVPTVFPFLCPDKWMRELFGASTDYQKMLKEQRERRLLEPQRQLLRFLHQFSDCLLQKAKKKTFNVANVFLGCSLEEQSPKINVEKSWREDAE